MWFFYNAELRTSALFVLLLTEPRDNGGSADKVTAIWGRSRLINTVSPPFLNMRSIYFLTKWSRVSSSLQGTGSVASAVEMLALASLADLTTLSSTQALCRGPGMRGDVTGEGSDLPDIRLGLWEWDLRPPFPWLPQGSFYHNILCYHEVSRKWVCCPRVTFWDVTYAVFCRTPWSILSFFFQILSYCLKFYK